MNPIKALLEHLNQLYRTPWEITKEGDLAVYHNPHEKIFIYYDYKLEYNKRGMRPIFKLLGSDNPLEYYEEVMKYLEKRPEKFFLASLRSFHSADNLQDLLDSYYSELFKYGEN